MQPSTRTRPRGLRIGVVLGETLIAEQVLEAGSFTIGRKASCSVPLPLPGLPARWELLTLDGRGARLRLGPAMDVRLADGATIRTRADLAAGGAAGADDRAHEVAIPTGGRGKITMGELKVMFHEVELAPRIPRPSLPRELRSTLADRVDRRLLAFAAASLAVHVGVMTAARLNDPPAELTRAEQVMADYQAETTVIDADQLPDFQLPTTKPPAPGASTTEHPPPTPEPTAKPTAPRPPGEPPARPTPTAPVAIDPAGDAARSADALFSDDPSVNPLTGDASRRRPSGDLAQQLAELATQHATASLVPGSDRELPQHSGPQLGTTDEPAPLLPGQVVPTKPPKPEPDHVRVTLTPQPKPPPGEPAVDGILGKIKTTYMAGLVRCYKKAMAEGGALSGKVVLAFNVGERGGVTGPAATGVDDQLEQCVEGLMGGWRFNPVVDTDGDATDVDVKVTLQLRPD